MDNQTDLLQFGKTLQAGVQEAGKRYDDKIAKEAQTDFGEDAKKWIVTQRQDIIKRIRKLIELAQDPNRPWTSDTVISDGDWLDVGPDDPQMKLTVRSCPKHLYNYAPAFQKSLHDLVSMLGFRKVEVGDLQYGDFDLYLYCEPRKARKQVKSAPIMQLEVHDAYNQLAKKRAAGDEDAAGPDDIMEIMGSNKRAKISVKKEEEDEEKPSVAAGSSKIDEKEGKGKKVPKVKQEEGAETGDDSGFVAGKLDELVKKEEDL